MKSRWCSFQRTSKLSLITRMKWEMETIHSWNHLTARSFSSNSRWFRTSMDCQAVVALLEWNKYLLIRMNKSIGQKKKRKSNFWWVERKQRGSQTQVDQDSRLSWCKTSWGIQKQLKLSNLSWEETFIIMKSTTRWQGVSWNISLMTIALLHQPL